MPTALFQPTPAREAAEFLSSKAMVSRQVFDGLLPELRARSFTVTGIEAFDVLQSLRDKTAQLPQGGDYKKIRAELAEEMTPWLGEKGARARAEILMRHHGIQSYRVAQWEQVQRHRDAFPYLQYIATRDERTRDRHRALNGIVLPVDDPFWQDHMPPWEWNCRCQVIQVSRKRYEQLKKRDEKLPPDEKLVLDEAARTRLNQEKRILRTVKGPDDRRRGVPTAMDTRTPEEKGRSGPGSQADLRIPLSAIKGRYDAKTFADFEAWARKTDLGDGRTVWGWLEGGEAGPHAAAAAGGADGLVSAVAALFGRASRAEAHRLIELPAERRGTLSHAARTGKAELDAGFDFVNRIAPAGLASGKVGIRRNRNRASADPQGRFINGKHLSAPTVVHELGHILEARNPELLRRAAAFRDGRTAGESLRWLGPGYRRDEQALFDEWLERGGSRYSGKVYKWRGNDIATEILSMGLERLYRDPVGFARMDPEYFRFVMEALGR